VKRIAKSTLMVAGGLVWLALALVIGIFLFQNLGENAAVSGFNVFGFPISSLNIGFGLLHVVGFSAAAWLCLVVGIGLCVHGLFPRSRGSEGEGRTPEEKHSGK
jgi:hypothetical protein